MTSRYHGPERPRRGGPRRARASRYTTASTASSAVARTDSFSRPPICSSPTPELAQWAQADRCGPEGRGWRPTPARHASESARPRARRIRPPDVLADHKRQHGVAQKGQRAIVTHARMLIGKGAMRQRLLQQRADHETNAPAVRLAAQRGCGGHRRTTYRKRAGRREGSRCEAAPEGRRRGVALLR